MYFHFCKTLVSFCKLKKKEKRRVVLRIIITIYEKMLLVVNFLACCTFVYNINSLSILVSFNICNDCSLK